MQATITADMGSAHFVMSLVYSKLWKDEASIAASFATGGTKPAIALLGEIVNNYISKEQLVEALGDYELKVSAQLMPIKHEAFKNNAAEDKQVTCIDIRPEEVETLKQDGWQIFPMGLNSGKNERLYNMLPVTGEWNKKKIEEEAWFPDHESLVSGRGFPKLNPFLEKANLVLPSQSITMYFKDGVLVKMHQKQPQLNGKEHPDIIRFGSGNTFTVSTATNIFTEVGKIGCSE